MINLVKVTVLFIQADATKVSIVQDNILILKDSKVEVCRGGSIDIQLRKVVGGEGGEGRGGGSIDIQLRKVVGGEGGEGGQLTFNSGRL